MDKDAYLDKVERLSQKVYSLNYRFIHAPIQRDADALLETIQESLEAYQDLVESDEGEHSDD